MISKPLKPELYSCPHRHNGFSHPNCYKDFLLTNGKIGVIDIETTGLKANWDMMLTWSIYDPESKRHAAGKITKRDIQSGIYDRKLVADLIKEMKRYDILIGYYSSRFDIPFIRTRALKWGFLFPVYHEIIHRDVYFIAKTKLCLTSNRLSMVAKLLGIRGKTPVDEETWFNARYGSKAAIDRIFEHNKTDTEILWEVYKRLVLYSQPNRRSI